MALFEVIKAHDGLQAGTIKVLPAGPVTAYMVKHGYWKELKDETPAKTKPESVKEAARTTKKSKK